VNEQGGNGFKWKMKRMLAILIIAFFVVVNQVDAVKREVNLSIEESVVVEDKNITMIAANWDSFILCVNGKKVVVADDRSFDGVLFDVRRKGRDYARFQISIQESKNPCEDCSNQACVESFNFECRTDKDCNSLDKCSIGKCENGKCAYSVDEKCRNAGDTDSTTSTTMTIRTTTTTIEGNDNSNKENMGEENDAGDEGRDELTGNVAGDSGKQLKRATFILLGFLAIVAITSVFIERRRRRGNDKKDDAGQIYY